MSVVASLLRAEALEKNFSPLTIHSSLTLDTGKMSTSKTSSPTMPHSMEVFTGVWCGHVHILPSRIFPHGMTATATYSGQWELAGTVILGREQYRSRGHLLHQAVNVFGWDWVRQKYALSRLEAGQPFPTAPLFGQWKEHVLTFTSMIEHGGFSFVYTFQGQTCSLEQWSLHPSGGMGNLVLKGQYERLGQ